MWANAYGAHDAVRDGAWVAELTDLLDCSTSPAWTRVIVRTIPAGLTRTGRRARFHLAARAPWADLVHTAVLRLRALAVAG